MTFLQLGALIAEAGPITEDIVVDATEIEDGGTVLVPLEPQVGTVQGKPIYLDLLSLDDQTTGRARIAAAQSFAKTPIRAQHLA